MEQGGKKRLIVGITGASGSALAIDLLRELRRTGRWEVHVVVSDNAMLTLRHEAPEQAGVFHQLADVCHDNRNMGAPIASGSFQCAGMIVVPCSMKTVAGICSGYSDNLLLRAADVTIKEGRKLILAARETPLSPIHLKNMAALSSMGVMFMPPMMTFYSNPKTVDEMVRHFTGKILDQFNETAENYRRWHGGIQ